jgi:hypothetical protein
MTLKGTPKAKIVRLVLLLAVTLLTGDSQAIDVAITGDWSVTVDASNLAACAGSDLTSIYESEINQGIISISGTASSSDAWRLDVRRSDTNWPSAFALYVRRTGAGTGNGGIISGGSEYQAVGTSDSSFFSGTGERSGVNLQLKATGVSLTVTPGTYSTSIVYTVVDTA